jgi:integrase
MKNDGKAEVTLRTTSFILGKIARHANLNNPEQVKQYVANLQVTSTYKQNIIKAYARYTTYKNIQWQKPKYERDTKQPKIPTTQKLELLIAKAGNILSLKLDISFRTGMRPIEVVNLKVKDIDFEHKTITPAVFKHGAPRTLPIPEYLRDKIQEHTNYYKLTSNDKLFKGNVRSYCGNYREMRDYLAIKLGDPSLRQIRLYDFRHHARASAALFLGSNGIDASNKEDITNTFKRLVKKGEPCDMMSSASLLWSNWKTEQLNDKETRQLLDNSSTFVRQLRSLQHS